MAASCLSSFSCLLRCRAASSSARRASIDLRFDDDGGSARRGGRLPFVASSQDGWPIEPGSDLLDFDAGTGGAAEGARPVPRAGLALLLATAALAASFSALSAAAFRAANSRNILIFFFRRCKLEPHAKLMFFGARLAYHGASLSTGRRRLRVTGHVCRGLSGGCLGVLSADRQGESCLQPVCREAVWRTES